MTADSVIAFDGVSCRYGPQRALASVTLRIRPGEFVALVGPNSSGKSTLLKTASGVKNPDAGVVSLLGKPLGAWPLEARARTLAMVSSEEYFVFPFSVREVVAMGRTPFVGWLGRESDKDAAVIEDVMRATDVWRLAARVVSDLSSGERQRVLLARALAQEPRVLFLDEPTAHLDIGHEWDLFDLLARLHAKQPMTVVCALHDLGLAARYATRVIVLKQGRIVGDGAPRDVFTEETLSSAFEVPLSVAWIGDGETALVLTPSSKGKRP